MPSRVSAFVVNRVKTVLASSLINIQNLVVVSHTVCVCACRRYQNFRDAGGPPFGMGRG